LNSLPPQLIATASGRCTTCASNCTGNTTASYSACCSLQPRSFSVSASLSSGNSDNRRCGCSTIPCNNTPKCDTNRCIRSLSNRSVLYSSTPFKPSPSTIVSIRSNFAVTPSTPTRPNCNPPNRKLSCGTFCNTSFTWNNGERLRSRSGSNSSTSFSNGTS